MSELLWWTVYQLFSLQETLGPLLGQPRCGKECVVVFYIAESTKAVLQATHKPVHQPGVEDLAIHAILTPQHTTSIGSSEESHPDGQGLAPE